MAVDWYCRIEGQEEGPVTSTQLQTMARNGQLKPDDQVRKGLAAPWYAASRIKGLFPEGDESAASPASDAAKVGAGGVGPGLPGVRSISQCIAREERQKRPGIILLNLFVWLVLIGLAGGSRGILLLVYGATWLFNRLFAEYNVRKLQSFGTTASTEQFPEVTRALADVRAQFGIVDDPLIIVLNHSSINAFAIRFARRKVIVLLSETLEGVLDEPAQLRFILAHEMAHIVLDHGSRGMFELYKSASYKAARELTCDNAGCAAAGDVDAARIVLKRLGVGNHLHPRLDDEALMAEARAIESGLTGWLLKQYMTYPPLGKRIANAIGFFEAHRPTKPTSEGRWDDPATMRGDALRELA